MRATKKTTIFHDGANRTLSSRPAKRADVLRAYTYARRCGIKGAVHSIGLSSLDEIISTGEAVYYVETAQGACIVTLYDAADTGVRTAIESARIFARYYLGAALWPYPVTRLASLWRHPPPWPAP